MRKFQIYLLILFLSLQISCLALDDFGANPSVISTREGAFAVEPGTLLLDINSQKSGIFAPMDKIPSSQSAAIISAVNWDQNDFVQIAQAIHQEVWNESMNGWKVSDISFSEDCPDIDVGLQHAVFELFKYDDPETDIHGKITFHRIMIRPRLKFISWNESVYSMSSGEVNYFELSDFIVPADEALRLAENKGGKTIREDLSNHCYITIHPLKIDVFTTWQVQYFSKGSTSNEPVFEYIIKN